MSHGTVGRLATGVSCVLLLFVVLALAQSAEAGWIKDHTKHVLGPHGLIPIPQKTADAINKVVNPPLRAATVVGASAVGFTAGTAVGAPHIGAAVGAAMGHEINEAASKPILN